ncbi:uncharacterized protein LOC125214384 isoform X2 [Salvia hispanica]|uniref:uncharacterized protein LOC125214384 isoform X2 n=1 Tax=Salvia hispanica TaxID=49212 RepID=UPI002009D236|nr:uncharacterized protein LOC125214384 isoform X2 [Salvia hispanica]
MAVVGNPNFSIGETSSVQSPNFSIGEIASDLDLCGKRKRGNEIQETDASMAKVAKARAKESRMVAEFTDFDDLVRFFKQEFIFEKEDFDLLRDYCDSDVDDDDILEEKKQSVPFDKGPVLKNLNQVRNSGLHRWLELGWYFIHLPLSDSRRRDYVYERAKLAIDEINVDMETKAFELVEIVRAVKSRPLAARMYLTLAVKEVGADKEAATMTIQAVVSHPFNAPWELMEWRFKP